MRRLLFIPLFLLTIGAAGVAQGIDFFQGTWAEALEKAKQEGKVIFVDGYAVWCGPCKRMANEVFPNPQVGAFYNRYFINMKLDLEKGEGLEFRKTYPVAAFPTLFFIDGDGEVVHKVKGAQNVEAFLNLGKKVLQMSDRSSDFAAEYEKGNRDPELVLNYMRALNNAGKSSLAVANEYLNTQKKLDSDFNLRFILEAAVVADSKIFDLLIEHRKKIEALEGAAAVQQRIEQACEATLQRAIEFQSQDLLREAQAKMKANAPEAAEKFELEAEMRFAKETNDGKAYAKASKKYAKNVINDDPAELYKLAGELAKHFSSEPEAMKQAEAFAADAAQKGNKYQYYVSYAHILQMNGKAKEARAAAEAALALARSESPSAVAMVENFIKQMEGKGF
jgi:thiol-disulfide isomerase/thioredoxin